MKSPKHHLRVLAIAGVAILLLAAPAQADLLLEFDELIFGAEGSVRTVGQVDVPDDLVAQNCQISVIAENQASVHPGNDLIVSTGDSQAVIVGVEDEVNGGIVETYQVLVGPSIVVQLRFGEDEMSSLGFGLSFDCDQTTTTTADPTLDGQQVTSGTSSTTATTIATGASSCDDGTQGTASTTDDGALAEGSPGEHASSPGGTDQTAAASSDCPTTSCDPDGSASIATDGSDGSDATTATTAASEADVDPAADPCPAPTAAQTPSPAPSTTTAPPTTTAPSSVSTTVAAPAPTAAAAPALPPTPVASAIVAAPAYAG